MDYLPSDAFSRVVSVIVNRRLRVFNPGYEVSNGWPIQSDALTIDIPYSNHYHDTVSHQVKRRFGFNLEDSSLVLASKFRHCRYLSSVGGIPSYFIRISEISPLMDGISRRMHKCQGYGSTHLSVSRSSVHVILGFVAIAFMNT